MIVHKTKTAMQDRTNPLETASYIFPISNRKNKTTSTQTHHCMVFLENTKKGYLSTNVVGVVAPIIAPRKGYGDFVHHTNPLKEGVLLTLSIDNSLFGLISVRESELVNPLIQLNSVDSTESANSLIMSKTCIVGTSPNVLMKSDANHFPSRDDTQKPQKEKSSVRSAALWDDCSFNHEENHYSTDLDNNADLRLYGTLSPAQTLHAEIIGAVDSANDISSAQLSGSGLAFLRWRRLISPRMAVTINCASVSFSSLTSSISLRTSNGTLAVFCCDLLLTVPVAITGLLIIRWCSVYGIKKIKKVLKCKSPRSMFYLDGDLHLEMSEAHSCYQHEWASNHNVTRTYIMACLHDTKTRPNFTYLFLGTPSDLPTCTPTVLRAEADSEAEARAKFIDWDLTFAAQIRTAAPSRLQLFSTDDGFMWIYEQRQEASHA